ncbi:MAG: guanylate kinase [Gammaproteobacteria bacterium]
MHGPKLYILSAASGTGKTSLARALIERLPSLAFSISHTTRAPRPGERDGVDYFFVSKPEFERMRERGDFLEHAEVYGNHYGTSRAVIDRLIGEGKSVLLDIDWQGARNVKRQLPQAVSIFILPLSRAALQERLTRRGQDTPEVVERRMRQATDEMRHYPEFDHVILNDEFEPAAADLRAILTGVGRPRPLPFDPATLLRP